MVFTSPIFVFIFLPVVILIYMLVGQKYRNAWLLIASVLFYSWSGVQYTIVLLALVLVNYLIGLLVISSDGRKNKRLLWLSLIINFGTLGFFKYFNFFVSNIESVIHIFSPGFSFHSPIIPLPVGISFFTFQIVSYIADIYLGKIKPQKNLSLLALYMTVFPPFIAGPIIRYIDIESQLLKREVTVDGFMEGVERFSYGFAKKILIANNMGALADSIINAPGSYSTPACWIGIIAYALQIYFDFSGYSDMVIGMGKMFGFKFLENFNYPYISKSIQEFWRRWHISLSSWFRDYLYIPLGGNRKSNLITYRNLIIVFLATGFWHGASWNFIFWGGWHGAFLLIERAFLSGYLKKIPIIGHIYTIFVVLLGWVFFRLETLPYAISYIKIMFIPSFDNWYAHLPLFSRDTVFYLLCGLVLSTPIYLKIFAKAETTYVTRAMRYAFQYLLFLVSISYMVSSSFNPFIYFRF